MSSVAMTSHVWTTARSVPLQRSMPGEGGQTRPIERPVGTLHVGERVGPYRLCLEIGSGGMGTVFLARREGRDGSPRYVALKCMHAPLSDRPGYVEMFLDEARIASQIHHPNVCVVVDFDVCGHVYFIAMEYLAGQTLKSVYERIVSGAHECEPLLHACLVSRIIADAAEGLHAAHELRDRQGQLLGVVHRDVSPENIFVSYDGSVKIVDFGLVRSSTQRHKTRSGIIKGKYAYIQPEVLRGQVPDRRADVWGLGVVMWELLTGRRLFHAPTDAATLQAVTTMPIQPPSHVAPGLPPELDLIVLRALARDPQLRYETTRELGCDLMHFMAGRGHAVGLADLAQFMESLFPNGGAWTRQLLDVADQVEHGSAAFEQGSRTMSRPDGEEEDEAAWFSWANRAVRRMRRGSVGLAVCFLSSLALAAGLAVAGGEDAGGSPGQITQSAPILPVAAVNQAPPPSGEPQLVIDDEVALSDVPETWRPTPELPAVADSPFVLEVSGEPATDSSDVVLRLRVVPARPDESAGGDSTATVTGRPPSVGAAADAGKVAQPIVVVPSGRPKKTATPP